MSVALNIAKGKAGDVANQIKGKMNGQQINVEWNEFNYPPLLKIMHYKLDELESDPELRKLVKLLFITHIAVFTLTIFNFISNIIQAASISESSSQWVRVVFSIIWIFIINPIHTYWFYIGYKGSVDTPEWVSQCGRFKIGGFVLILLYFVQSILKVPGFNGWMRVAELFKGTDDKSYGGLGAMAMVENFLIYALMGLMLFVMWKVHFRNV